jgi:hypothetical protein
MGHTWPIAKHYRFNREGNNMTKLATHAERVAARKAINGQPNGYRPMSEGELQAEKGIAYSKDPIMKALGIIDTVKAY